MHSCFLDGIQALADAELWCCGNIHLTGFKVNSYITCPSSIPCILDSQHPLAQIHLKIHLHSFCWFRGSYFCPTLFFLHWKVNRNFLSLHAYSSVHSEPLAFSLPGLAEQAHVRPSLLPLTPCAVNKIVFPSHVFNKTLQSLMSGTHILEYLVWCP